VDFWGRVKYVLDRKNATRPWLAQATGISLHTLNGWVNKQRDPRIDEAEKIARALEVSIDYLVTGRVIDTIDDPDIEDMCNMLRNMTRDELMMAKGMLFSMQYSEMKPKQWPRERAEGSA